MAQSPVSTVQINRFENGETFFTDDLLAVEEPLEIRIQYGPPNDRNEKKLSLTMRTPGHDFELAIGFLHAEGLIRSNEDIAHMRYCTDIDQPEEADNILIISLQPSLEVALNRLERNFLSHAGCGICGKASIQSVLEDLCPAPIKGIRELSPQVLHKLSASIPLEQTLFSHTGGLHAAALCDLNGEKILLREDIGRHNALDKVIGAALYNHVLPAADCLLFLSGRVGFELVQKAIMAGIGGIVAVGAPSSLAVELARQSGLGLWGFLKHNRWNQYNRPLD